MQETCNEIWREIASGIRLHLSADAFQRWFSAIELVQADEIALTFQVPNTIYQFWIESNYLNVVQSAAMSVLGSPREIKFRAADSGMTGPVVDAHADRVSETLAPTSRDEDSEGVINRGMNPRNRFEAFVVGSNNQFAHAAALAVSQSPAKTYNPLFIYGGVGLGKTHLMQAIGQQTIDRRKIHKVMYLSSERFIDAIQHNMLVRFRKRYRQTDILLIDDIHFLAGKERSQEEFFHTFNTLFDGRKQIVLSSDRPASEIANLEQRLVSRFEWGLTAEFAATGHRDSHGNSPEKGRGISYRACSGRSGFSRPACPIQCSAFGGCLDAGCLLPVVEWPRDFPRNGRTTSPGYFAGRSQEDGYDRSDSRERGRIF
jgi:chromosomal replication initiator protein